MTKKRKCGCAAGVVVDIRNDIYRIEACEECKRFETDEDASAAVCRLLALLDRVCEDTDTVADALDVLAYGCE